jgi:hypothetical protein
MGKIKVIIFLIAIFTLSANAQIKYTDLSPDVTITSGDSFLLNLNPDADIFQDFKLFQYSGFGYSMVGVSSKWTNAVLGETQFGFFYPYALELNDPIGNSSTTWKDDIDYELGASLLYRTTGTAPKSYGFWKDLTEDRYLGLRLEYYDKTVRYGWVRIIVSQDGTSFTIKDYAYNSQAGQTIYAGQKYPVGIDEFFQNQQYTHFISNNVLNISFLNPVNENNIRVYNMSGQEIYNFTSSEKDIQISLTNQKSGLYIFAIQNENGTSTSKFILN